MPLIRSASKAPSPPRYRNERRSQSSRPIPFRYVSSRSNFEGRNVGTTGYQDDDRRYPRPGNTHGRPNNSFATTKPGYPESISNSDSESGDEVLPKYDRNRRGADAREKNKYEETRTPGFGMKGQREDKYPDYRRSQSTEGNNQTNGRGDYGAGPRQEAGIDHGRRSPNPGNQRAFPTAQRDKFTEGGTRMQGPERNQAQEAGNSGFGVQRDEYRAQTPGRQTNYDQESGEPRFGAQNDGYNAQMQRPPMDHRQLDGKPGFGAQNSPGNGFSPQIQDPKMNPQWPGGKPGFGTQNFPNNKSTSQMQDSQMNNQQPGGNPGFGSKNFPNNKINSQVPEPQMSYQRPGGNTGLNSQNPPANGQSNSAPQGPQINHQRPGGLPGFGTQASPDKGFNQAQTRPRMEDPQHFNGNLNENRPAANYGNKLHQHQMSRNRSAGPVRTDDRGNSGNFGRNTSPNRDRERTDRERTDRERGRDRERRSDSVGRRRGYSSRSPRRSRERGRDHERGRDRERKSNSVGGRRDDRSKRSPRRRSDVRLIEDRRDRNRRDRESRSESVGRRRTISSRSLRRSDARAVDVRGGSKDFQRSSRRQRCRSCGHTPEKSERCRRCGHKPEKKKGESWFDRKIKSKSAVVLEENKERGTKTIWLEPKGN